MLKTRVLTAIVIALVAFMLVFLAPPAIFRLAMAALLMVGCREFTRLAGLGKVAGWVLFTIQSVLMILMITQWHDISHHALTFLSAATLTWCVMFLRLITFRPGVKPAISYFLISSFCALASISFAWYALSWIRDQENGKYLFLLLMFIIWAADTGAYFAGRQFGKHKLAAAISPGKTREGLLGGVILAALVAFILAQLTIGLPSSTGWFAALVVITALTSAAGDLFISLHKRTVGLKDSGKLFPGHGGVLDRFDSLLSGAPFFALGIFFLAL